MQLPSRSLVLLQSTHKMTTINQTIDAHIQANLERALSEISTLCAQPSVSARGEGVRECSALVEDLFKRYGLLTQIIETGGQPVVLGFLEGASPRRLMCYNHYDVQPPEPLDKWTTPPFQPTIRDGALYARGARDDKGEIVCRLAAIDAVRAAHGGTLPCSIVMVAEGEEEIGSPHMQAFVQQNLALLRCDGAIWEEGGTDESGRHRMPLGARGILAVELSVETMARDAHSGGAHILPSAAWRLVWTLATLKDADERVLIGGFYEHARGPSARDSALMALQPDPTAMLQTESGAKAFLGGRSGPALNEAVFNPTCTIEGITTGYQGAGFKTVIPARASAKLDFRLVMDQDPEDIFRKLRAHLDAAGFADVKAEWLGAMWPTKAEPNDPLVALAARTAEDVYGMPSSLIPTAGGSSPIYAFSRPLNIPVITAGIGNMQNRQHAPDEFMRLSDFVNGTRHVARIIDGFAGL